MPHFRKYRKPAKPQAPALTVDVDGPLSPADEYGALHNQIEIMRARQKELLVKLVTEPDLRHGATYRIDIKDVAVRSTDFDLLAEALTQEEYKAVVSLKIMRRTTVVRLVGETAAPPAQKHSEAAEHRRRRV